MNNEDRIEVINRIIKKLEKIRDTEEIEEINIIPFQEVEETRFFNGEVYVILSTIIEIRSEKLYQKGDITDDFIYKAI